MERNALGQAVGADASEWTPRREPSASVQAGRYCRLERLDPDRHADELFAADDHDVDGRSWTYLPYGPFADLASYRKWVEQVCRAQDLCFYAVLDTGAEPKARAVGAAGRPRASEGLARSRKLR